MSASDLELVARLLEGPWVVLSDGELYRGEKIAGGRACPWWVAVGAVLERLSALGMEPGLQQKISGAWRAYAHSGDKVHDDAVSIDRITPVAAVIALGATIQRQRERPMTPPSLSAEAVPSADASTDEIAITNPGYAEYLRSNEGREIVRLVAERDALRSQVESLKETNTRLNRRCQEAESALPDYKRMLVVPPDGDGFRFVSGNLGRALLATQCARLAEQVEALRASAVTECVEWLKQYASDYANKPDESSEAVMDARKATAWNILVAAKRMEAAIARERRT